MNYYLILPSLLILIGFFLISYTPKQRVYKKPNRLTGVFMIITAGALILSIIIYKPNQQGVKPTYLYIGKNIEDSRIDTIYSIREHLDNCVWVNMDSMFVDGKDPFATKYIIIKRIK